MIKPEIEIKVALPRKLADDLKRIAEEYDLTNGAIIREALTRFIEKQEIHDGHRSPPKEEQENANLDFAEIARADSFCRGEFAFDQGCGCGFSKPPECSGHVLFGSVVTRDDCCCRLNTCG